jgi:hypothetical protein
MNWLARFLRTLAKVRFRLLRHSTIKDVPTDQFNDLIRSLIESGWTRTSEYDGLDAWIDYGYIRLRKNFTSLKCEWDNWTEGSIEGPRSVVEAIAARHGLSATRAWRWNDYDQPRQRR